jgi:Pyruvate/2-oxoacid:ferredoxin oxidoreductase gamma subunit
VLTAAEAVVKGVLECSAHVSTLTLARAEPTLGLAQRLATPAVTELLREHRLEVRQTTDAARAVRLGRWAAAQGGLHVVLAAGHASTARWIGVLEAALPQGAALAVVLESTLVERSLLLDTALPVLEPGSPGEVRDAVEHALRISRSSSRPVLIAVSSRLFRSGASVDLRPNHGEEGPRRDGTRHRSLRWDRQEDPLRLARRLELNQFRELPSPGETAPVGIITVGKADDLLQQVFREADDPPRVPVLHLGLSVPLDDAVVGRLLDRCRLVVVIEPGSTVIAGHLRAIADDCRSDDRPVATVAQLVTPDTADALAQALEPWIALGIEPPLRPTFNDMPQVAVPQIGATAMRRAVRKAIEPTIVHWSEGSETSRVEVDGTVIGPEHGTLYCVETWTAAGFRTGGEAAIQQTLQSNVHWVHLIVTGAPPQGAAIERLAAAFVPPETEERPFIQRLGFGEVEDLQRALVEALERGGVSVIVCVDVDVRWDSETRAKRALDADRTGFRPLQRVVQGVDRFCNPYLMQAAGWDADTIDPEMHGTVRVDRLEGPWRFKLALRIRPQAEMIEITRTRAPKVGLGSASLPVPVPNHAQAPVWQAHLAGLRGRSPGVAGRVLTAAGNAMGYTVHWRCDPSPTGPGRRAWAQIRFEQPPAPGTAAISFGRADLLLAVDAHGVLDAVGSRGLCSPERTCMAVSIPDDDPAAIWLEEQWGEDRLTLADVEETCRRRFHTDRLADMVLLGVAFQRGWIPLTLDALRAAMQHTEDRGHARLAEAFAFGRQAAMHTALLAPERATALVDTPLRRSRRWRLLSRFGTRAADDGLGTLLDRLLVGLPDLTETADGRAMRGLLVDGVAAAVIWGGIDTAQRLADEVLALYRVDRADTGRALTRAAIGPLVSALVFQDPIYVARMAISPGHRAALRRALNVRSGRGDIMEVRYLTRLEAVVGMHHLRVDVRTSKWIAYLGRAVGRFVPTSWRGSPRQRAMRSAVWSLVQRARAEIDDRHDHWRGVLEQLRQHQEAGDLEGMSAQSVRSMGDISETSVPA